MDVFGWQACCADLRNQLPQSGAELDACRGGGRRATPVGHESSVVPFQFQPAFFTQCAVGLSNSAEVHTEIEAKAPNGWEGVTGAELAIDQQGSQAIDDLPVCGRCRGEIDLKRYVPAHLLYVYQQTTNKARGK